MSAEPLLDAGYTDPTATDCSRAEMAEAGLAAFFALSEQWGLSRDAQRVLLGNPSRSRFYEMARTQKGSLSDDELDRLSYLLGIYAALNTLYKPENTVLWLKNPSGADSIWRGLSPLDYMLSGKLVALADVRRYLDALRG